MANGKNVAKKEQAALPAEQVPGFMKGMAGMGTEAATAEAVTVPRLRLLQALSPELEEDPSLRQGEWFHSIAGISVGKEVTIVPCYVTESYFLFAPRKTGGGLLARADDGVHWNAPDCEFEVAVDGRSVIYKTAKTVAQSGLARWGTSNPGDPKSPPAADHSVNVVVILPEHADLGPCVLSFMKSGLKTGKKFVGNLKLSPVPSFGRLFVLSSAKVDGPSGPYFEPRLKPTGFVQEQEDFNNYKTVYETFKAKGVHVDAERAAQDAEVGSETPSGGVPGY